MYKLSSILSILNVNSQTIIKFISSQIFNYCLHVYDNSYKIPNYVYFITFNDHVKIGRTFKIDKRYTPSILKDNLRRIVFVKNVEKAEKELKKEFSKKYEYYNDRTLESFKVNDINRGLQLFDRIVKKYKIKEIENKHIQYYHMNAIYGTDFYLSYIACSVLISIFADINYNECLSNINDIELFYNKINKNDFIAIVKESKHAFQYWKYYGYIIIIDNSTNQLNISRLWKSIVKTDNLKDELYMFLKAANISRLMKNNNIQIEKKTYKNKPLLNGKYGPIVFIHLILHYLNAKYMFEVATILTDMVLNKKINIQTSNMKGGSINNDNILLKKIRNERATFERYLTF